MYTYNLFVWVVYTELGVVIKWFAGQDNLLTCISASIAGVWTF